MTTSFSFFDALKEDQAPSKSRQNRPSQASSDQFFDQCRDTNALLPKSFDQSYEQHKEAQIVERSKGFAFSFKFDDPSTHNTLDAEEISEVIAQRAASRRSSRATVDRPRYWDRMKADALAHDTNSEKGSQDTVPQNVPLKEEAENIEVATFFCSHRAETDEGAVAVPPSKDSDLQTYKEDDNGKVEFDLSGIEPITPFVPVKTVKIDAPKNLLSVLKEKQVEEEPKETEAPTPVDEGVETVDAPEVSENKDGPSGKNFINETFEAARNKARIISGTSKH